MQCYEDIDVPEHVLFIWSVIVVITSISLAAT